MEFMVATQHGTGRKFVFEWRGGSDPVKTMEGLTKGWEYPDLPKGGEWDFERKEYANKEAAVLAEDSFANGYNREPGKPVARLTARQLGMERLRARYQRLPPYTTMRMAMAALGCTKHQAEVLAKPAVPVPPWLAKLVPYPAGVGIWRKASELAKEAGVGAREFGLKAEKVLAKRKVNGRSEYFVR